MPFSWFPEEVVNARREADKDPPKKQLGDVAKLKGNSYYEKMIEDLGRHKSTKFTRKEMVVDKTLGSPFFDNLEEWAKIQKLNEQQQQQQQKQQQKPSWRFSQAKYHRREFLTFD